MRKCEQLLGLLADGQVHSGAAMARAMNCSRTAVWKQLRELRQLGLDVAATPGRGYQLPRPIELLDRTLIERELHPRVIDNLEALEIFGMLESTSNHLRSAAAPPPGKLHAVLAEYQTDGRARRGRRWLSPYASGLCLSVSWSLTVVPPTLSAFSLAVGVAVYRSMAALDPEGLGLKWPNDIVAGHGKLGGVLVDVEGESAGPIKIVVGVGINIDCSDELENEVDAGALPPVSLRGLVSNGKVSRNIVAAHIINELHAALVEFAEAGFAGFIDEWTRHDKLLGKRVSVKSGVIQHEGIASGIGPDGALVIAVNGETVCVTSGEVSLRSAQSSEPDE
jgi:BirA family biotin operon repressor/biotin-[acetyl-CoA-carboxylase] ligase